VSKTFPGGVRAVDQIDLLVRDGELVVLVGPSGCGKTTSLRMIAGLETVTEGKIRIADRVVNEVAPKDRDIAMVFQSYALYPHMTVYKNMAFGLRMRRLKKAEIAKRVKWASEMLGLEDLLNRKPRALSGGQRQRVALGRAIVRQPQAFLFDEPLSNLDARLRVETRAELKRLHRRLATTTIYVTHDQEEAMTLGDRIAIMDRGRLQQFDTPLTVYHQPANRFVAGFLGMPPMNFLEGTLRQEDGSVWFQGAGARLPIPPPLAEVAAQRLDESLVLGVRPEAIRLDRSADHNTHLRLKVSLAEPLGNSIDVYATTAAGVSMTARVTEKRQFEPQQEFSAQLDPSGVHLFEPGEHGANLTLSGADKA
jgi:multiple sugar transport system ATP-binding protein